MGITGYEREMYRNIELTRKTLEGILACQTAQVNALESIAESLKALVVLKENV